MRNLGLLAALAVLGGCVKTYVVTAMADDHYVLVRTENKYQKVYDCEGHPDGTDWKPTCVAVDFENDTPKPPAPPKPK